MRLSFTMRNRILLFATVAISVPETSLSARTREMSSVPVTPYVTFSGSDRAVMAAWHRQWQVDGVFCVLYDDRRAHCEAGDDRSGDPVYAYARGNSLAQ